MTNSSIQSLNNNNYSFTGRKVRERLAEVGIEVNGPNPWDMQVHDESIMYKLLLGGSLALGESYMDKKWEVERLDEMMYRIMRAPLGIEGNYVAHHLANFSAKLFNFQSKARAFQVGEKHYDLGNDIYEQMLDRRMVYTCGYWKTADNLDQAQEDKLDLVCQKLNLKPGMKILDIGCGWGSFINFAVEKYDVEAVGVTVSKEQVAWSKAHYQGKPIEFRLQDYRDIQGQFDAIISIGMFEHVGHKNYHAFMNVLHRCLKDKAMALLHTIGKNTSIPGVDPWIAKYIFPNGETPSLKMICAASESKLVIEDLHNFGADYDRTLMAWYHNFEKAWPELKQNYSDRFYRMWTYYLQVCAGAFRARDLQLWQIVFSKGDIIGGYRRPNL